MRRHDGVRTVQRSDGAANVPDAMYAAGDPPAVFTLKDTYFTGEKPCSFD